MDREHDFGDGMRDEQRWARRTGKAVDVEVIDRGTGATATLYAALIFDASASLPNAMILVSAPAGSLPVGSVAAVPMAVRLVMKDGVTPVPGAAVVFSAAAGSASFGACGAAVCTVLTDATGLASSAVTPLTAGTITVQAAAGALVQSVSFTAQTPAGKMILNRAPSGLQPVGCDRADVAFWCRYLPPTG